MRRGEETRDNDGHDDVKDDLENAACKAGNVLGLDHLRGVLGDDEILGLVPLGDRVDGSR